MVAAGNDTQAVSRGIQRIASRIARLLNKLFKRRGRFFRDRFHLRVIRTPTDMRNVLSYVLLNHQKDAAKRGIRALAADTFSSARFFDGWARDTTRRIHVCTPEPGDPVTSAKSWLLNTGWRKLGLIRFDERAPPIRGA